MIIVKANHRLSLFGGATDYPEFIDKYAYGVIISAAINISCYICIKKLLPFHKYKTKITYDQKERVYTSNKYIHHPIFRNCIKFVNLEDEPLEINFISDAPGGSGLGTGSTMIVCLLKALYEYKSEAISQKDLLSNAFYVERTLMGEPAGYQDYLPAIYGDVQYYELVNSLPHIRYISSLPGKIRKLINDKGLLFYTGTSRKSSTIINKYLDNITCREQVEIRYLAEEAYIEMVERNNYDYAKLCTLMNMSQQLKEKVSPAILPTELKEKMNALHTAGSDAVRLLGGGGGGSIFVLCEPERSYNILEAGKTAGLIHIPFQVAEQGVERIL